MKPPLIPSALEQRFIDEASAIAGWLQPREMRFLSLAVLKQRAVGEVVELGFYQGKSTSVLARTMQHLERGKVTTVDPIDPAAMTQNMKQLDLLNHVDIRHESSLDFAKSWDSPIALLWHDGANDLGTVQQDCENLFPYLQDQAIVAFHDVLNASGERVYAFDQLVLNSPHFGWTGVCGSIGYGRYHRQSVQNPDWIQAKRALSRKLGRLKPYHKADQPNPTGLRHIAYRILRSRVPHAAVPSFQAVG